MHQQTQLPLKQMKSCLLSRKAQKEASIPEPADSAFTNPREKEEEEWQAKAAKLKVVGKEALFTACPPKEATCPATLNDTLRLESFPIPR